MMRPGARPVIGPRPESVYPAGMNARRGMDGAGPRPRTGFAGKRVMGRDRANPGVAPRVGPGTDVPGLPRDYTFNTMEGAIT